MAGHPHGGPGAGPLQRLHERVGALDVEDHLLALAEAPHDVLAQECQDLVAEQHRSGLVHRPDAVPVAIERDAQIGVHVSDARLQVAQVGQHGRVGVVVREGAVRLAVQAVYPRAEGLEDGGSGEARDPVPAVHDNPERARERPDAVEDLPPVRGQDVVHREVAGARGEPAVLDPLAQRLDVLSGQREPGEDHLEAVHLRWVVRSGHLHAAVGLEMVDGEVECGGRDQPHREHRGAGGAEALDQRVHQRLAGGPVVATHGQRGGTAEPLARLGAHGRADCPGDFRREVLADGAPDVVLPEDDGGYAHRDGARGRRRGVPSLMADQRVAPQLATRGRKLDRH